MSMRPATVFVIRKMLRHYTDAHTAKAAGLSVEQLKSFSGNGSFQPTEDQLVALARRMKLEDYTNDRHRLRR